MKKYLIVSLLTVFLFSLSLFTNDSNEVQAATIGQQLTQPEAGWKRYDDTYPAIKYLGTGWTRYTGGSYYNGSFDSNIESSNYNTKMQFTFFGSKIRLISLMAIDHSDKISVSIDGVEEFFSANAKLGTQILLYEKTGLSNRLHTVEIKRINSGYFSLDAIDIDSEGYLTEAPILEGEVNSEGHSLTWNSIVGATGYNVKRSLNAGGPYEVIASNVNTNLYLDKNIEKGKKYFYVVTAIVNGTESPNSNEVSLPIVENSNATLILHLLNNQIKEYNLTSSELNNFLSWFSSGTESFYVFTIKSPEPPYNSIKDYIIKDKIVWFQVKEY